jgi:hypothetical protein
MIVLAFGPVIGVAEAVKAIILAAGKRPMNQSRLRSTTARRTTYFAAIL